MQKNALMTGVFTILSSTHLDSVFERMLAVRGNVPKATLDISGLSINILFLFFQIITQSDLIRIRNETLVNALKVSQVSILSLNSRLNADNSAPVGT